MKKSIPLLAGRLALLLFLCVAASFPRGAMGQPTNYALDFNNASYVSLTLPNPPATNYTISAWVYLRQAGGYYAPVGILSAPTCGGSIELLIDSPDGWPGPQYIELGACGHFNGQLTPYQVPLNTWTRIAVTLGSNNLVSIYVNGAMIASFIDPNSGGYYTIGTSVYLGGNGGSRTFDGMMDEVQIWNRALSAAEIQADNASLTGSEPGLYAYYRFDEGSGGTVANSAVGSGVGNGILANNPGSVTPGWVTPGAPVARVIGIGNAGTQQDLGSGWRTPSVPKPLDIDGDNILGTDGYYFVNLPPVLPAYISQATILTSTFPGDPSYASVDDPTHPGNLFVTGTMNAFPGTGTNADLFAFVMGTNATRNIIRVGLMVDNLDDPGFNAASLELLCTNGAVVSSGVSATTSTSFNNQNPDWVFFDISGAEPGDVFVVRGTGGLYGAATLGGVAFDSASPLVTTTNDSGPGSLRAAVSLGGNIVLAPNLSGQMIVFTNGPIQIQTSVTIDASALPGSLTLSGYNGSGIFNVGAGAAVSLTGLTLTNGQQYDGGAVYGATGSTVTLIRCTLGGNSAVEGGALVNDGAMTLIECTLAGNSASYGGAMECRGATTISQCTISGNSGYYGGGGLWIGNSPVTVGNSIIAGNSAPQGSGLNTDIEIDTGALTYASTNLVQFVGGSGTPTGPAPLTNAPMLSPLGNYGGPMQTMPPLAGSPAIDASGPAALNIDQRGFPRVIGPASDLGATEFFYTISNLMVTTAADSGLGSLRYCTAHSIVASTITFDPSLSGQTILLTNGEINLLTNCIIDASALPGGIRLDGQQGTGILQVNDGASVTLNFLRFTNGNAYEGGAIQVGPNGALELYRCDFQSNNASYGGAIYNSGSSTTALTQCTLSGNSALEGGAIYQIFFGELAVTNCVFSGNIADPANTHPGNGSYLGGAIYGNSSSAYVTSCVFSGNVANYGSGGAISENGGGPFVLANCTFLTNSAKPFSGGAILAVNVALTGCSFLGNSATGSFTSGGAIYANSSSLTNCTFVGNSAGVYGGALANSGANASLINCTILGNSTATNNGGSGGGIETRYGTVEFTNCIIVSNTPNDFVVTGTGSITGANSFTNGDPMLAPLGNYGGPTPTMPPLLGSPVIDAGNDAAVAGLATDQRGYPRISGSHVDLGAAEFQNPVVTSTADSGPGSLRAAVGYADAGGTITFAPNLSGQTILLTNGQITLVGAPIIDPDDGLIHTYGTLTIDASSLPGGITISGNHASRIFYIPIDGIISLESLTLINGNADQGGAIDVELGQVTLGNCFLVGNSASAGGAIYSDGGVVLNDSTLSGNSALNNGGAILNNVVVTLNASTLSGNSAPGGGGAIYNENDGQLSLNECTLAGNSAANGAGGAIFNGLSDNSYSSLSMNQCTVYGNSAAASSAGGIFNDDNDGDLTSLNNSIVSGNTAVDFSGSYSGTPNLVGGNAKLAPLGNYGGPTQTMPPLPGSPAIDACTGGTSFATDQRGYPRILGLRADLGAVEGIFNPAGPGLLTVAPQLENGTFQFGFTNYEGMTQTILTTTNLAVPLNQWTILGTAVETPAGSGNFQFNDPQTTNYLQRYYRATSP